MKNPAGFAIIALGVIILVWSGYSYSKKSDVIIQGPFQITITKKKTLDWPAYIGGLMIIGGIVAIATSKKTLKS